MKGAKNEKAYHFINCLCFLLHFADGLGRSRREKGASQEAYEHADDNAVFNRVGDWFATVGKSKEEKEKILAERKAERATKRAEKEAEKMKRKAEEAKGEAEKEAKRVRERTEKQAEEMKQEGLDVTKGVGKGMGKGNR